MISTKQPCITGDDASILTKTVDASSNWKADSVSFEEFYEIDRTVAWIQQQNCEKVKTKNGAVFLIIFTISAEIAKISRIKLKHFIFRSVSSSQMLCFKMDLQFRKCWKQRRTWSVICWQIQLMRLAVSMKSPLNI